MAKPTPSSSSLEVLYEDNHLIAINKKSSDIVQGDQTGDESLIDIVKAYIKKKYDKPGDVFLGLAHRIDRPVSGVVIFSRTSKALERMTKIFKNREIKKTYLAITQNQPPSRKETIVKYLKKDSAKNKSFVHKDASKGALECELSYTWVAESDRYNLLRVQPKTGRHHQIRVMLANIGAPIKGDLKYGAKRSNEDGSISLHAYSLEFVHPVQKVPMKIVAPLPDKVLWNAFSKLGIDESGQEL